MRTDISAAARDENRIFEHAKQLSDVLQSRNGAEIQANECFNFFIFDVMGELVFAKSFDTLVQDDWHGAVALLMSGMRFLSFVTPVPWLAQILFTLPGIPGPANSWNAMIEWCKTTICERLSFEIDNPDVCDQRHPYP